MFRESIGARGSSIAKPNPIRASDSKNARFVIDDDCFRRRSTLCGPLNLPQGFGKILAKNRKIKLFIRQKK